MSEDLNLSYIETLLVESQAMVHLDKMMSILLEQGIGNELVENIRVMLYEIYYSGRLDAAQGILRSIPPVSKNCSEDARTLIKSIVSKIEEEYP